MKYWAFVLSLYAALPANGQQIHPGQTGEALLHALDQEFSPTQTVSYSKARSHMFGGFDNRNGEVRCVHTGVKIRTDGIPNAQIMNTEHTWPQSRYKNNSVNARYAMTTDIHHLFPTLSPVNAARQNNRFNEIPDTSTQRFWDDAQPSSTIPTTDLDANSESTATEFEPREDHKGNVARALAYFYTVHGENEIDAGWFLPQVPTLIKWHLADPADDVERARCSAIALIQGNENPYVLDPTLMPRAFSPSTAPLHPFTELREADAISASSTPPTPSREELVARIERLEEELRELRELVETP